MGSLRRVDQKKLERLLLAYRNAPMEFQATEYWNAYERAILDTLRELDLTQLRSGRYPVLATFGFLDQKYFRHPNLPRWKRAALYLLQRRVLRDRPILPYDTSTWTIRETAHRHCELLAELTGSKPVDGIEVSSFGSPSDVFEIGGRAYTMKFLSFYVRYCLANRHLQLQGNEVIVELGSGSGYQIEVLKKLYPDLTVLCFDLPAQLYLCEEYLSEALGSDRIVGTDATLEWSDLSQVRPGAVHFLGNWQAPLLQDLEFDVFWNAASFGEMEPSVVENYLSFVRGQAAWVYLLQARVGRETVGKNRVDERTTLDDYQRMLSGYELVEESDAWEAHKPLSEVGGYFQGVWRRA